MRWSYAQERHFIKLAKTATSLDEVVKRTGRAPKNVRAAAVRLGVKLAEQIATDTQLLAALHRAKRAAPAQKRGR